MEKIKFPKIGNVYNGHKSGHFAVLDGDNYRYESCRDRFQTFSDRADFKEFFFCHTNGRSSNVISFMKTVEQIAGVKPEDALIISPTTSEDHVHVLLPSEWWKHRVRRSLMTALLRCGDNFLEDTGAGVQAALKSNGYTAETMLAIERFLDGCTAIKLSKKAAFGGWWQLFKTSGCNPEQILVKLKRRKGEVANDDQDQSQKPVGSA